MRVLVVAAVVLAGCSAGEPVPVACERFHQVAVDYTDGVLTEGELRGRLQEVANRAVGSPVEGEARSMLAEITSGTSESFDRAVSDMSTACAEYR